ncbi:MAG: EAL domain-containing protein [Gammaproteobacteria bacterium]|nr:EAL domain-containing protein [Gammaproteobacteria bacterium]
MKLLNNKLLMRPYVSIALVMMLLLGTSSVIIYFQKTLLEIEEALPITLSKQERDIRVLVNNMGALVQNFGLARADQSPKSFRAVFRQTLEIERHLETVRENYRFDDVLGVSAIHAKLNPAIVDIKNWLTAGLFNFEPTSAQTMKLAETRAKQAHREAEILLQQVGETAIDVLTEQSRRIDNFRGIMIITLTALGIMAIGLVMLGFRLQSIVFALRESEEQIRYRANYDSLTDLPNRLNFIEHLSEAISRGRRDPGQIALLFIDLDRFKTINDTLGHDYGDELIKQVAGRIRQAVRETDVVSRLGGDEFTVLLANMAEEMHATIIAKSILDHLSRPFMLLGHEVYSGASIGITVCPQDGADAMTLLKNADMAMYEAKDQGRNTFRFFTSQMTDRARQFLELDKEMRRALIQDELQIHFQPIYELKDRALVGVEALLRWQHPSKGLVLPDEFIKVAEETGLIEDIGLWVLRRACEEAMAWLENDLHPDFYLSINISMRQFKGGLDRKCLGEILDVTGFPADKLQLEITETLLMDDDVRIKDVLSEFRQMGIRLAVDDFGTGYSALSYLREFPVNTLKIDRSFIQDIVSKRSSRKLVETIITMAHGLELVTIAEGVETAEQDALLSELNCNMVQGYHYCRPVAAERIRDLTRIKSPNIKIIRSR